MTTAHLLMALLVIIIWGFNFVVIKVGLASLPPILFSALRFVFAALPLVFFVKRPAIPWRYLAGYGVLQFALQFSLLFGGIKLGLAPGLASLVIQLQAFFTIGLAVMVLRERPTRLQFAGAALGLAGMVLVAVHIDSRATLAGFALVVAAGMSWAGANLLTKRIGPVDPLALVGWGSLVAAPPLLIVSLLADGPQSIASAIEHLDWVAWGAILFNAYPNTLLCFGIWAVLVRRYSAATVAPFSLLIPIAGMASAALVLGEAMPWWKIGAGALVLAGLALNQWDVRARTRGARSAG
jgi:O-acetylserine/cysteine efflux transporter